MNAKSRINKSFKIFKTLFDALLSKSRFRSYKEYFPKPLITLQSLNAANVGDVQRVSVLAAGVSKTSVLGSTDSKRKSDLFSQNIAYDLTADVLPQ